MLPWRVKMPTQNLVWFLLWLMLIPKNVLTRVWCKFGSGKYLEKENVWCAKEKKMSSPNIFPLLLVCSSFPPRTKHFPSSSIFLHFPQERNYFEKEKIWRRKICGPRRKRRTEKERNKSFGEGKLMGTLTDDNSW